MPHAVVTSRWWIVVLACAAWPAVHLRGIDTLQVVLPLVFALGAALLWRAPRIGAMVVCAAQATTLLSDASPLSPAGLVPGLVCLVVLGLTLPRHRALPVVACFLAIIVLTDLPMARMVIGIAFFLTVWALADHARRRRHRLAEAREQAARLAAQDVQTVADRVVARERQLLVARSAEVVHATLAEVRELAGLARRDLDPDRVVEVRRRAASGIDELRDLLGLVRDDDAPEAHHADDSRPEAAWRGDVATAVGTLVVGAVDLRLDVLEPPPATYVLGAALAATLSLRRTRPALATALAATVMTTALALGAPMSHGLAESAALALLTWTAVGGGGRLAAASWSVLVVTAVLVAQPRGESYPEVTAGLLLAIGAISWAHGRLRTNQEAVADRVARLEAETDAVVRDALTAGRAGLAQDLHDVVGHALGVMLMQAGAAEVSAENNPEAARTALAQVAGTGDDALAELAALSQGSGMPEPFADAVDALVDRIRSAGVDLTVTGALALPPGQTATLLHRVVQESLTNAIKHAPGAAIELTLASDETTVSAEVVNTASSTTRPGPGSRSGLVGLAQRVTSAGGRFEADPVPGGGFRLRATLSAPPLSAPPLPEVAREPVR